MAWGVVSTTHHSAAVTAVGTVGQTCAYASTGVTTGHLLIIAGAIQATGRTPTTTDSIGTTGYAANQFVSNATNIGFSMNVTYGIVPAGSDPRANTVTQTWDTASSLLQLLVVTEFSGVPAGWGLDGTPQFAQGTSGTTGLGPTLATSDASDLLVYWGLAAGTGGAVLPWTELESSVGSPFAYILNFAAGSQATNMTDSSNSNYGVQAIAFGVSGGGPPASPHVDITIVS
jgi:hypothetical protein